MTFQIDICDITTCDPQKSIKFWAKYIGRSNGHEADSFAYCLIYAGFLLSVFFYPEVGGDMFFRNV
jgi:hypothetical protein